MSECVFVVWFWFDLVCGVYFNVSSLAFRVRWNYFAYELNWMDGNRLLSTSSSSSSSSSSISSLPVRWLIACLARYVAPNVHKIWAHIYSNSCSELQAIRLIDMHIFFFNMRIVLFGWLYLPESKASIDLNIHLAVVTAFSILLDNLWWWWIWWWWCYCSIFFHHSPSLRNNAIISFSFYLRCTRKQLKSTSKIRFRFNSFAFIDNITPTLECSMHLCTVSMQRTRKSMDRAFAFAGKWFASPKNSNKLCCCVYAASENGASSSLTCKWLYSKPNAGSLVQCLCVLVFWVSFEIGDLCPGIKFTTIHWESVWIVWHTTESHNFGLNIHSNDKFTGSQSIRRALSMF